MHHVWSENVACKKCSKPLQICLEGLSIKAYPRERYDLGFSTNQTARGIGLLLFRGAMEKPDHLYHDLRTRSTDKRMTGYGRIPKPAGVCTPGHSEALIGCSSHLVLGTLIEYYILRASSSHYLSKRHILLPHQVFPPDKPTSIPFFSSPKTKISSPNSLSLIYQVHYVNHLAFFK